ncbi:SUKH-4 family immunity protein [Streptomyces sp. NPDC058424]|uniref:SUKH-4 family immunity protein n=1 Tax=Streptomyces sp. NPDC058424 TaxID=3346491 RepID=UPI00366456D7
MVQLEVRDGSVYSDAHLEIPAESVGYSYWAAESLDALEINDVSFLRFGYTGMSGSILLNPATGEVVESGEDLNKVSLVNTSLERFAECIRAVIDRCPFYSNDASDEEWESAANDVERIVCAIDSNAYIEDGYWSEMVSDITMGDYADLVPEKKSRA